MAIKPNNLGQQKKQTWGVVGKRKDYTNEAFNAIELEKERERYDWKAKLKPWSAMDKGQLIVMMPEKGTPTPPPTYAIWETTTTNWEATADNWDTI